VIIDDLHISRSRCRPSEANTELVVNSDAALPDAIPSQNLQAIAGRNPQVTDLTGAIQHGQLPHRRSFNSDKSLNAHAFKKFSRVGTLEGSDRHFKYTNNHR